MARERTQAGPQDAADASREGHANIGICRKAATQAGIIDMRIDRAIAES